MQCLGIEKSLGGLPVLRGVNLTVRRGETLVILGGSGCGKTVLLKHLNGLLRPDAGQVLFDGVELGSLGEEALVGIRQKIGMLFQGAALFDSLTVGENVAFPLREQRRMEERSIAAKVRETLELVGLPGAEKMMPSELSGGMRKRAGLARALASQPQVVLYDEPTTGLDPVVGARINALIKGLQHRLGLTSVVVTHDLQSAFYLADRLAFLNNGVIEEVGTPQQIRSSAKPALREFLSATPSLTAQLP